MFLLPRSYSDTTHHSTLPTSYLFRYSRRHIQYHLFHTYLPEAIVNMAAVDVLMTPHLRKPSWTATPLIAEPSVVPCPKDEFSHSKHLAFTTPPKTHTMKEIGLDGGVSPIAVSQPFQLFTTEAVMRMREEVLSEKVMEHCQYSSNLAQCQLRGFANKYVAPPHTSISFLLMRQTPQWCFYQHVMSSSMSKHQHRHQQPRPKHPADPLSQKKKIHALRLRRVEEPGGAPHHLQHRGHRPHPRHGL